MEEQAGMLMFKANIPRFAKIILEETARTGKLVFHLFYFLVICHVFRFPNCSMKVLNEYCRGFQRCMLKSMELNFPTQ